MIDGFKNKFYDLLELLIVDEVINPRNQMWTGLLATFYLFVHFCIGFALLWFAYNEVSNLDNYDEELSVKAFFETLYLLIGVIWGNVGWDGFNRIKEGAPCEEIVVRFFKFTLPCIGIVGVIMNLFIAYNRMKDWDLPTIEWFQSYYHSVSGILIYSILFVFIYLLFKPVSKLKQKLKQRREARKTAHKKTTL
jgi:uncharacterized membrane protein